MTCPRVRVVPPSCTCGRELDITVFHGEDDIGNDLCPTCSGCGCEPNERNLMNEHLTPEQLDELRPGTVLRDVNGWDAVKGVNGRWYPTDQGGHDVPGTPPYAVIHPVPEPDHSMCARLVPHPDDPKNRHGLQSPNRSYLTLPHDGPVFVAPDDYWRERGYAIPEPEPTVVERAARVIAATRHDDNAASGIAEALDRAGLLARDGEQ